MNPFRSGLGKAVLVAGACSSLVLGAVQVAGAAAPPAVRSGAIPFTSASVDGTTQTSARISWTAPGAHVVFVFSGSRPDQLETFVGAGGSQGDLVVRGSGRWFTLVPDSGRRLSIARRDLGLLSDPNFRDIGGYRTRSGQWVRMGAVYRSAALSLSPADVATVSRLGIASDYDLRTPGEQRVVPDVVPAGATRIPLNVMGIDTVDIPAFADIAAARAYMRKTERDLVTKPSAKSAYRRLLEGVADRPGAGVYHCSAGKDRTGWATAILLTLLGVPKQAVIQDYLLSNEFYFHSPAVQAQLAAMPPAQAAIFRHALDVEPSYLEAGFAQVHSSYGSMYRYVVQGLSVAPATISRLRQELLIGA